MAENVVAFALKGDTDYSSFSEGSGGNRAQKMFESVATLPGGDALLASVLIASSCTVPDCPTLRPSAKQVATLLGEVEGRLADEISSL